MVNNCLIINLDERTDLWKNLEGFREEWTKLGKKCERIPGVSYKNKTNVLNEFIANGKLNIATGGFRTNKQGFLGELGCYMGHYNAWKHIVDNQLTSCLIVEDGIKQLRSDYQRLTISPDKLDILFVNAEMEINITIPSEQVFGYGLQGYIVTYECAQKLLKECNELNMPIDLQIAGLCHKQILKATALFSPYVMRDNDRLSSIDGIKSRETTSRLDKETFIQEKQNPEAIILRILTNLLRKNVNLDDLLEYTHDYEKIK
jgi:GR25 family glycosyltransferase involved in LPS biosynthesis